MDGLQIEMTPQRKNFLEKFAALLILREHTSLDLRSSQAAMEVILNFHRHPIKQERYLRAVVRNLDAALLEIISSDRTNHDHHQPSPGASWDCPGHCAQGFHLTMVHDAEPIEVAPQLVCFFALISVIAADSRSKRQSSLG